MKPIRDDPHTVAFRWVIIALDVAALGLIGYFVYSLWEIFP